MKYKLISLITVSVLSLVAIIVAIAFAVNRGGVGRIYFRDSYDLDSGFVLRESGFWVIIAMCIILVFTSIVQLVLGILVLVSGDRYEPKIHRILMAIGTLAIIGIPLVNIILAPIAISKIYRVKRPKDDTNHQSNNSQTVNRDDFNQTPDQNLKFTSSSSNGQSIASQVSDSSNLTNYLNEPKIQSDVNAAKTHHTSTIEINLKNNPKEKDATKTDEHPFDRLNPFDK